MVDSGIKAVCFDLWQTLILETDGADRLRSAARCRSLFEALATLGPKIPLEEIVRAYEATAPWLAEIWKRNEDVTHLEQIDFILKEASHHAVNLRPEWIEPLTEAYISPLFQVPPQLDPEAAVTLGWLKGHGYGIGLISNVGRTPGIALRRFLAKERLLERFDVTLFSDEARARKPGLRIFQMAAERLDVGPTEILHVGDNPKADVWGAKNAGMKAALLCSGKGWDREAESNPSSLFSISRRVDNLVAAEAAPDATVTSLRELVHIIASFEDPTRWRAFGKETEQGGVREECA